MYRDTESKVVAMGGLTTSLNYIRTGQYYLNKGGSYKDFFPEVLARSQGNFDVDAPTGTWVKVSPPIRPRADVEYLWQAVLNRQVDWIVSDHACCSVEQKVSFKEPDNIWLGKSGLGGTEYSLVGMMG